MCCDVHSSVSAHTRSPTSTYARVPPFQSTPLSRGTIYSYSYSYHQLPKSSTLNPNDDAPCPSHPNPAPVPMSKPRPPPASSAGARPPARLFRRRPSRIAPSNRRSSPRRANQIRRRALNLLQQTRARLRVHSAKERRHPRRVRRRRLERARRARRRRVGARLVGTVRSLRRGILSSESDDKRSIGGAFGSSASGSYASAPRSRATPPGVDLRGGEIHDVDGRVVGGVGGGGSGGLSLRDAARTFSGRR